MLFLNHKDKTKYNVILLLQKQENQIECSYLTSSDNYFFYINDENTLTINTTGI